jgi:hypothetical protein
MIAISPMPARRPGWPPLAREAEWLARRNRLGACSKTTQSLPKLKKPELWHGENSYVSLFFFPESDKYLLKQLQDIWQS